MIEPRLPVWRRLRLQVIGGALGLGGMLAILSRLAKRRPQRPSAAQLMQRDDAAFGDFISRTGLKTVSSIGSDGPVVSPD